MHKCIHMACDSSRSVPHYIYVSWRKIHRRASPQSRYRARRRPGRPGRLRHEALRPRCRRQPLWHLAHHVAAQGVRRRGRLRPLVDARRLQRVRELGRVQHEQPRARPLWQVVHVGEGRRLLRADGAARPAVARGAGDRREKGGGESTGAHLAASRAAHEGPAQLMDARAVGGGAGARRARDRGSTGVDTWPHPRRPPIVHQPPAATLHSPPSTAPLSACRFWCTARR